MTNEENMCLSEFWKTVPFTNETLLAVFTVLTKMDEKNTICSALNLIRGLHEKGFKVTPNEP